MPQRTFRVKIANPTADLMLTQTFSHLCNGQWTGGWAPPAAIAPASSGGMQSESNGVFGYTEGYAKYNVAQVDSFGENMRLGMIYVYWNNPFFGITHFLFQSALGDVYPNCDFSPPKGSPFPPDAKSPVTFAFSFTEYQHGTGGDVTNITDLLGLIAAPIVGGATDPAGGPVLAVAYLAGFQGIDKHPELDLSVGNVAGPPVPPTLGGGSSTTSLKLLTHAAPGDWVGSWSSEDRKVTLEIALTGVQLSANIHDATVTPPITLAQTFAPGPQNLLVVDTSALGILERLEAKNPQQAVALHSAAASTIEAATKARTSKEVTRTHFRDLAAAGGATATSAQAVGETLANLIQPDQGVAYLSEGIVLQLYAIMFLGKQSGSRVLYQRVNGSGEIIASEMTDLVQAVI